MRIVLAILMVVHGLAHLVGFAGAWRLAPDGIPYKTTILAGSVDLGDSGIRAVGLLWLGLAAAFIVVAVGAFGAFQWWPQAALAVAIVSLLLSATEWPEARLGVVLNVAIVAALLTGRWLALI